MLSYIKNIIMVSCALLIFNSASVPALALDASLSSAVDSASMGAEMLKSVVIDVERDFGIELSGQEGGYAIDVIEGAASNASYSSPAFIRITGAAAEVMIDIENNIIQGYDGNSDAVIRITDFKILDGDAGASVMITPPSGEGFYIFSVGGTVEGSGVLNDFYTGANIINVNYL